MCLAIEPHKHLAQRHCQFAHARIRLTLFLRFSATGTGFAAEFEDVVRDIITTAKGLSARYAPMGAVLIPAPPVETIRQGSRAIPLGHSFSWTPIGADVCMAVPDHIKDNDVLANVATRGAELEAGLNAMVQRYRHMADVRGREVLWGFEHVLDRQDRTPLPVRLNVSGRFMKGCKAADLIVYL